MIKNVDEILDQADLQSIIEKVSGVTFSRKGSNLVCLSPFTSEKTPSFSLSLHKDIYKCFSTGLGGDNAASFIMQYRKCTFPEALEEVASILGIVLDYGTGSRKEAIALAKEQKDKKEQIVEATKQVYEFYTKSASNTFNKEKEAYEVAGKVYKPATVKKWGLVTTGSSKELTTFSATWSNRETLVDAGLLKLSQDGKSFYDGFHSRLVIPQHDTMGRIVGFSGRILNNDTKAPKYINSPESPAYNKSEIVFGYFQNWKKINETRVVHLFEGPTDVIMLDQAGIHNVVCSSGTAFTRAQAKVIKRIADTVIICFDGDKAGKEAIVRAIKILVPTGIEVLVKLMPADQDPASFVTIEGAEAFSNLDTKDGIEYLVSLDITDPKKINPYEQTAATITAVSILADIKSDQLRNAYVSSLAKIIDIAPAALKSAVKSEINARIEKINRLSDEQEKQKILWNIYIDKGVYVDYNGNEISNFIITPLFLVSFRDKAKRVFQIINKYGHSKYINMESDDFITLAGFRKHTERLGSYIWKGNDLHYIKLREWLYHDMKEVFPVETLGYQPTSGLYAWSDGITLPNSHEFRQVDEHGLVTHDDVTYFLPTFSKINLARGENMEDEFEQSFRWGVPKSGSNAPRDLEGWSKAFAKVFKKNASIALCYIFASIYRDLLHKRYDMFPHLNLFGPAGSGKTFMAQIITGIFGKPMRATHLVSSTEVSFYRRIAQVYNAIIWYEEYSEKVDPKKQEALKNFADGFGRTKGQMTRDNKIESTPVYSAAIISGQILPSHDPALLERCVTLYFEKVYASKQESEYAEQFKAWSKEGVFSFVTAEIHSHRQYISENFADMMEDVRDHIRSRFSGADQPSSRVLNNFAMITAIYKLLSQKVTMPFRDADLYDSIVQRIREQSRAVEGAEELSGFWSTLVFLMDRGRHADSKSQGLTQDHFSIETEESVVYYINENEKKSITFDKPTRILYLRLAYAHKIYVKEGKAQGLSRVLEEGTLKHYLKIHKAYIGETKAKRLATSTQRCWIFNLEELPAYEWQLTTFKKWDNDPDDEKEKGERDLFTPDNPAEGMSFQAPVDGQNIPF